MEKREMRAKLKVVVNSEAETIAFASSLSKVFLKGTIITLKGDLGAGKTHFVKGAAMGLGSSDMVTSPTFTILNVYEGGKMPIYHFDMYRLGSAAEAEELGFNEYFDASTLDGVTIVEWPENVKGLLRGEHLSIEIEKGESANQRIIYVGKEI